MALYNQPVAVLGSCIVTADGLYVLEAISLEEARRLVQGRIVLFVGHHPTNDLLTRILGIERSYVLRVFSQEKGQIALICELNELEIEGIGYSFKKLIRYD